MLTLHTDIEFTRRKRLHAVMNDQDELLWTGAKLSKALEFCFDQGHYEIEVDDGEMRWRLTFAPAIK